jgi:glycosyltransferase involved in cell wall biosynthesis
MTSQAHVLLVLPSFAMGGAERVMVVLSRALALSGVRVTVIALDARGPLRDELERGHQDGPVAGVELFDLGRSRARMSLVRLVRVIRRQRPTLVLVSQTHLTTLIALVRPLLGDARVIARAPSMWRGGPRETAIVRLLRRLAHRRVDLVVASSEEMRAELAGLLRRRVEVLANPVDVAALRRSALRAEATPGEGRQFVCVSRLTAGKGIEDLLRAFSRSAAADDRLLLIGDGPERGAVVALVSELGLSDRVRLTGTVPDPAPLVAAADVLVVPSHSEGMPNAALEALAVGTPVLATTDLVTLTALARRCEEGTVRLATRDLLGEALAATPRLTAGPRPSLLPDDHEAGRVAAALLELAGLAPAAAVRPLQILMPILSPYPSAHASTIQSANMAQALCELGHAVALVAPNDDPALASVAGETDPAALYGFTPTFTARTLGGRVHRGQSYRNALRIAAIARRERPDLVLARDLRGCLLPARAGIPTVYEVHSLTSLEGPQERWVIRQLLRTRAFLGFIAISAPLANDLAEHFGIDPARILVAHDAVRLDEDPGPPPVREGSTLRVGYTGSLFAGRGVELLVAVAARAPWIELHLVGGPDSAARAWSERIADVPGARIVVHGMVTPSRARVLQRTCDVLVAPFARKVVTDSGVDTSRWMSPMKAFEYMASGRPIVISDLPVLREIMRPDIDALMIEPEDADALMNALERLRDDPGLGARLAASALERVRAEFTWDIRARRILERFGA